VSIEVISFASSTTAQRVADDFWGLMKSGAWWFGLVCPQSGTGANLCTGGRYNSVNTYVALQHRYVIVATALYADGTTRATTGPIWLRGARQWLRSELLHQHTVVSGVRQCASRSVVTGPADPAYEKCHERETHHDEIAVRQPVKLQVIQDRYVISSETLHGL
jgi:hypothetical protein